MPKKNLRQEKARNPLYLPSSRFFALNRKEEEELETFITEKDLAPSVISMLVFSRYCRELLLRHPAMSVATACARTWEKYTAGENLENVMPDSGYSTEMLPDKDMEMGLQLRQGNLSTEAPTPSLDKSLEVSPPSVASSLVEEDKQAADADPLAKAAALMLRKNPNGRIRRVVDRFTPASLDLFYNQVMEEMQGGKYECDWAQHLSEKTVADLEQKFETGDGFTPVQNWKYWRSWNIL